MSTLRFEKIEILGADLGLCNPLPDFNRKGDVHDNYEITERVTEDERKNLGKGKIHTILPYQMQDDYNRERKMQTFNAAILENDKIKAVFLPELGGRLWSLYHKIEKRDLVYENPIFQPANLALRNAWFAGGVEWNIGMIGHTPFTCSKMFTEEITDTAGDKVLRMYEYERIRDITYSVDAKLPEDSDVLYIKITVENTSNQDTFMYWWSNIAIAETDKTRVVIPADEAYKYSYEGDRGLFDVVPIPMQDDIDISYPTHFNRSCDMFFRINENRRKWIAALEDDGRGLLQFSTNRLIGRKLFMWGQGQGGKNWNTWLCGEGQAYAEIQAGLARTQLEHFPMLAGEKITWVEGYSLAKCDKNVVTTTDWHELQDEVEKCLNTYVPVDSYEETLTNIFKPDASVKIISDASGWGSLENMSRSARGMNPISTYMSFPETSLDENQKQWEMLLKDGVFPDRNPADMPIGYMIAPHWAKLLEDSINCGKSKNWHAYYHLGVMKYAAGDMDEAKKAFFESLKISETAWAYRNLSLIFKNEDKDLKKAEENMLAAVKLCNTCKALIINCGEVLLASKGFDKWIEVYKNLPDVLKNNGRIKLYLANAYFELENYDMAKQILDSGFEMYDNKEGEVSISDLWFKLHKKIVEKETGITDDEELTKLVDEKYPLPKHLDFRMK